MLVVKDLKAPATLLGTASGCEKVGLMGEMACRSSPVASQSFRAASCALTFCGIRSQYVFMIVCLSLVTLQFVKGPGATGGKNGSIVFRGFFCPNTFTV